MRGWGSRGRPGGSWAAPIPAACGHAPAPPTDAPACCRTPRLLRRQAAAIEEQLAALCMRGWVPGLTLSASIPASPPAPPACQVAAIREQLAALYEAREEWSKAAHALAGIDLDSGMRLLDAGGRQGWLGGAERWVGDGRPASWAHRMRLPGAARGSDADCWCAGSPRSPGRRSSARAAQAGWPRPSCLAACYPTATCCLLPAECKLGKRAKACRLTPFCCCQPPPPLFAQSASWASATRWRSISTCSLIYNSAPPPLRAEYKLGKCVKVAMLFLEDDDAVAAETYIKKASSLVAACKVCGRAVQR